MCVVLYVLDHNVYEKHFFIKHLYTGPEYGTTGQSKTPSCQSGRLMIKQCAMKQKQFTIGWFHSTYI